MVNTPNHSIDIYYHDTIAKKTSLLFFSYGNIRQEGVTHLDLFTIKEWVGKMTKTRQT